MAEPQQRRASDGAKEHAIAVLSDAFASEKLSMEEFERRVEQAHRATTHEELERLLKDVPASTAVSARDPQTGEVTSTSRPAVPSTRVRDNDRAIAIFGETKREGRWIPARSNQAIAALGSTVLDFRDALLGPGETEVKAVAVLGSVEIIVPPDIYVDCAGSAILGAFESQETQAPILNPEDPVLRIDGVAVLGDVTVEVRLPGENKRDAKRRRRRVAKQLREDRRRLKRGEPLT